MRKINWLRTALVGIAIIMLVHYLLLTAYLPAVVNTSIEIGLTVVEIILIYAYVKAIRNVNKH